MNLNNMDKSKKIKIFIGIFYSILVLSFLIFLFKKFSLEEISSYKFIQSNSEYFFELRNGNLIKLIFSFLLITIFWVFMLGFGSPVAIIAGFIFGKWLGTLLVVFGCTVGATFLYLFSNYFLRDLIKNKFLIKFKSLEEKFKRNEFNFFLIYRFVGGIPFCIANILPVLFNVKIKNYFFGTLLGILPALFVMTSLGSGIEKIIKENKFPPSFLNLLISPEIYTPILGFFILIIVTIIIKKKFY